MTDGKRSIRQISGNLQKFQAVISELDGRPHEFCSYHAHQLMNFDNDFPLAIGRDLDGLDMRIEDRPLTFPIAAHLVASVDVATLPSRIIPTPDPVRCLSMSLGFRASLCAIKPANPTTTRSTV